MDHLVNQLFNREIGRLNTKRFVNSEAARVVPSLEMWKMSKFPRNHKKAITSLDVDGAHGQFLLASSNDGIVRIHNIFHPSLETSSKIVREEKFRYCSMKFRHAEVECVQWYPKSFTAFTSSGRDGNIKIWDVVKMKSVHTFAPCTVHRARIYQHSQSHASTRPLVAAASTEATIAVVDLRYAGTALRFCLPFGHTMACEWSKTDEFVLASGGYDCRLRLWDIRVPKTPRLTYCMNDYMGESTLGPRSRYFKGPSHTQKINGVKFTVDGNNLISFSTENSVRMWDVYGGGQLHSNCGVVMNSGRFHLQMDTSHHNNPSLAFIPTEKQIIAVKVDTGEIVNVLKGHFADVRAVKYNPFYQELYTGGIDRTILMWKPHQEQSEAIEFRINNMHHTHSTT